jgi:predicted  nucleic acid-binding Zn-ribbon protein
MTPPEELEHLRLRCARLQCDNEAIRQERDNYRKRCADTKRELTELQNKNEDLECEIRDMKRKGLNASEVYFHHLT